MKKIITIVVLVFGMLQVNAQSNRKLAYSYIRKANRAIEKSIDYSEALINFNKAVKLLGVIKDKNIASLGARAYFEIHHKQKTIRQQISFLEKSHIYSKQYFLLATNKYTSDYRQNVELYNLSRKTLKKLQYKLRRRGMAKF
ncbi:hypothetical protein [Polaribacter sp. M15]